MTQAVDDILKQYAEAETEPTEADPVEAILAQYREESVAPEAEPGEADPVESILARYREEEPSPVAEAMARKAGLGEEPEKLGVLGEDARRRATEAGGLGLPSPLVSRTRELMAQHPEGSPEREEVKQKGLVAIKAAGLVVPRDLIEEEARAQETMALARGPARLGTQFFVKPARGIAQVAWLPARGLSDLVGTIAGDTKVGDAIDAISESLDKPTEGEREISEDFQERLQANMQSGNYKGAFYQIGTEYGLDAVTGLLQVMMLGSVINGTAPVSASGKFLKGAQLAKFTKRGGALGLVVPGVAGSRKAILANAGIRGIWSFLTTPGSVGEKFKSGAITTAFMSTPYVSSRLKYLPGVADLGLNSLLSYFTGQYPQAWEEAKQQNPDDFDAQATQFAASAMLTFMQDLFGSIGTRHIAKGAGKLSGTEVLKRVDKLMSKASPEGKAEYAEIGREQIGRAAEAELAKPTDVPLERAEAVERPGVERPEEAKPAEPTREAEVADVERQLTEKIERAEVEVPKEDVEKVNDALEKEVAAKEDTAPPVIEQGNLAKRAWAGFVGHFRAFGRQKVMAPELHKQLMGTYHRAATAVNQSIDKVTSELERVGSRSIEESVAVAIALEQGKRSDVPKELLPLYDAMSGLRGDITKAERKAGVLGEGFPDGALKRIREQIAALEQFEGTPREARKASKQVTALREEAARLEKFTGYLPHRKVAQKVMQAIYESQDNRGRRKFAAKLEQFHRERKGRATLREYLEAGIIDAEDTDIGRLAISMQTESIRKLAIRSLLEYGASEGLLRSATDKLAVGPEWIETSLLRGGANIKGLEGKKIHKLFALGIEELSGADKTPGGPLGQILTATKVGQFFKPSIIWTYNSLQRHIRGAAEYRPWKDIPNYAAAWRAVLGKDERYQEYNAKGLYQEPELIARGTADELAAVAARQTRTDVPKIQKWLENLLQRPLFEGAEEKGAGRQVMDAVMSPLRAISRATWFYDQVQRTHTAVNLERQGWDRDAAITYAALAHGGYSTLGPYKNWARYTFFVHSFRILMPIEVGKSLTAPFKMALDKATGKPIKGKARTAVKAFIATLAIPQVIHAGLTEMGWEPEEIAPKWWDKSFVKRRVLGRWKYKKAIMHDGEKREAVIGVNNIINMPVKWIDRLTKQQPHKMKLRDAGLFEVFRWELHPFYRIIGDAFTGEASMGDIQPWRAGDPSAKQVADAGKYIWLNMFRLYLEGLRHLSPDNESFSKYRMKQREELNSALNVAEKVLLTMELSPAKLGYAYTRKDRMARVQNMGRSLKGAIREAKMVAGRFPDSEERSQELDEIQEERLRKIETMYGTRIPRATSRRRRRSVVPEATLRF